MSYKFHPFEVAFSGNSGTGKTTLIEKLVKNFSQKYSIAYIKSDVHGFMMDKEGKDTFRIYKAGAQSVYISDFKHRAYISKKKLNNDLFKEELLLYDIVLIEGYKEEKIYKYLFSDKKDSKLLFKDDERLLGIIKSDKNIFLENKVFHRDDIDAIKSDLELSLLKRKPKLNALILVGGKSSRMGTDKALIKYGNKTQVKILAELLSSYVENVFVSVNENQYDSDSYKEFNLIKDRIEGIGPIGGLLSAFINDNKSAYLVVACDMPLIDDEVIVNLIKNRDFLKFGTFYENDYSFEPLIAIYEPKIFNFLLKSLIKKSYSIKKNIKDLPLNLIKNKYKGKFKNINTLTDKERLMIF